MKNVLDLPVALYRSVRFLQPQLTSTQLQLAKCIRSFTRQYIGFILGAHASVEWRDGLTSASASKVTLVRNLSIYLTGQFSDHFFLNQILRSFLVETLIPAQCGQRKFHTQYESFGFRFNIHFYIIFFAQLVFN